MRTHTIRTTTYIWCYLGLPCVLIQIAALTHPTSYVQFPYFFSDVKENFSRKLVPRIIGYRLCRWKQPVFFYLTYRAKNRKHSLWWCSYTKTLSRQTKAIFTTHILILVLILVKYILGRRYRGALYSTTITSKMYLLSELWCVAVNSEHRHSFYFLLLTAIKNVHINTILKYNY